MQNTLFSQEQMDNMVPNSMFANSGKVTCLGKEFPSDEARREYFRAELRKKLPELRGIEGFPIGEDDDIINLSDPPYYTACPNPWLNDFIAQWEEEKKELSKQGKRSDDFEVKEPYAADVSDIKNDSVYRAHSYHTKVPHTVIMRYILHYTQPGDIVLDGFAGTGMTGLACQSCANPTAEVKTKVLSDFTNTKSAQWGIRHSVCADLSPYASLISYNYNTPLPSDLVKKEVEKILTEMENEYSWMYTTMDDKGRPATINCVIWSDVCSCTNCGEEFVYWDEAVDYTNSKLKDEFMCPHCGSIQYKKNLSKVFETKFDSVLNETVSVLKSVPVRVAYTTVDGKRLERRINNDDLDLLEKINNFKCDYFCPTTKLPRGFNLDQPQNSIHIYHFHQFYTKRNLIVLSAFYNKIQHSKLSNKLKFIFTGMINRSTKMNRVHFTKYLAGRTDWDAGHLKGTLYIPSFPVESSVLLQISNKLGRYIKAAPMLPSHYDGLVSVNSAEDLRIKDESIDYIFVDPPFGSNIMYSELNTLPEAWLRVFTNNNSEAISNPGQGKDLQFYFSEMQKCFSEFFRILKPGKWMTVEFSNTSATVWNSIQTAIKKAGFVIANVSSLNKGQGGMRSITSTTAVKEDLAITCYKPSKELVKKVINSSLTSVWDFIDEHLNHLSLGFEKDSIFHIPTERDNRLIYDRLVSYFVQKGLPVPIDAKQFQIELEERYVNIDNLYFTTSQAIVYRSFKDKYKIISDNGVYELGVSVSNEAEGISWLKGLLGNKAQTYQEIQPKWLKSIMGLRKGDILPELKTILEENFIEESDGKWRLPRKDDADMEALRMKALLKEFKIYVEQANKGKGKLKEARLAALQEGFRDCYQNKDYATIVLVGEKIPQNLLEEDEKLLQFYDIAKDKI